MAFRMEAAIGVLIAAASLAAAQDYTFEARRRHGRKGSEGSLTFDATAVRWKEAGKKRDHSGEWRYQDIQRLTLSPERIEIITYDDNPRLLGRDQRYEFDHLPEGMAVKLYPWLRERLDQRFLAHLADPNIRPQLEIAAKLLHVMRGSNGKLLIADDEIVFDGSPDGESRTWRISDISFISQDSPLELTLTTVEGESRFQLKQALPEARYQALWRRVAVARGLDLYNSRMEHSHHE